MRLDRVLGRSQLEHKLRQEHCEERGESHQMGFQDEQSRRSISAAPRHPAGEAPTLAMY